MILINRSIGRVIRRFGTSQSCQFHRMISLGMGETKRIMNGVVF
ncbi:hypothetical protein CASFOL_039368 [Castilleja foliolosa]|uniref:Uncharacterized protein n=1 Tax=Castilleja foliolosa TaxID=1961234 RepID=A0ABD3BID7_9LAMI